MERVIDEQTFLVFVRALIADREGERGKPGATYGPGANGWENDTIESFLGAALARAESTKFGKNQDLAGASPWKIFATFLYCGKIYE